MRRQLLQLGSVCKTGWVGILKTGSCVFSVVGRKFFLVGMWRAYKRLWIGRVSGWCREWCRPRLGRVLNRGFWRGRLGSGTGSGARGGDLGALEEDGPSVIMSGDTMMDIFVKTCSSFGDPRNC